MMHGVGVKAQCVCDAMQSCSVSVPPVRLFVGALSPQLDKDDMVYMEAYDKLLESWLTLLQDDEHFPRGCFVQPAVQVFNSYIQCHLAAPDGTRNLVRPLSSSSPSPHPSLPPSSSLPPFLSSSLNPPVIPPSFCHRVLQSASKAVCLFPSIPWGIF